MKKNEIKLHSVSHGKIFSIAILLGPILGQYASFIPGVSLGDIFLAVTAFLILFFNRGYQIKRNTAKPIILFWFYGILISGCSFLLQQQLSFIVVTRIIRFSFYVFLIIICADNLNKEFLLTAYKKISVVISCYIIIQYIIYNLSGILLPFKILPFSWLDGRLYGVQEAINWAKVFYLRPSGVFLEPAYAAQYLLPSLFFSLIGWSTAGDKKVDVFCFIIIQSAIALTNSATGLLISAIIIIIYILQTVRGNKRRADIAKNIIIVFIFIIMLVLFANLELTNRALEYIFNNISGGTTGLRIFRGFAIFSELEPLYKLIGVGHANVGSFVINNGITTIYDATDLSLTAADYTSTISASLLYYGIGGIFTYVYIYKDLWSKTSRQFKLLVLVLFVLSCGSSNFFNITMIFYFSLIYLGYKPKKQLKPEVVYNEDIDYYFT